MYRTAFALSLVAHLLLGGLLLLASSDRPMPQRTGGVAPGGLFVTLVATAPRSDGEESLAVSTVAPASAARTRPAAAVARPLRSPRTPILLEPAEAEPAPTAPDAPEKRLVRRPPPRRIARRDPDEPAPASAPIDAVFAEPSSASPATVDASDSTSESGSIALHGGVSASAPAGGTRADWPRAGDVDRAARPRWPIRPDYPSRARRQGEESTVLVEAWVDDVGEVAFASVLRSGGDDFDASAQRAVQRAAFQPARLAGRDVASRVALRVHFELYD